MLRTLGEQPTLWESTVATSRRPPARSTVAEAAQALRLLLAATENGEIDADDPKARALHRRMEGAVAAWEKAGGDGEGLGE
jgi:hypothetical protein